MIEKERPALTQPVTKEVRAEARALLGTAGFAALSFADAQTGAPNISRVGLVVLGDGRPAFPASGLTAHFAALSRDPRCALLVGEPGKGDPLAHKRMSVIGRAVMLAPGSAAEDDAKARYLASHPKAGIYLDLPDFRFFAVEIETASFNGGFGRAHRLTQADFTAG